MSAKDEYRMRVFYMRVLWGIFEHGGGVTKPEENCVMSNLFIFDEM
jgi:hypothetical protein